MSKNTTKIVSAVLLAGLVLTGCGHAAAGTATLPPITVTVGPGTVAADPGTDVADPVTVTRNPGTKTVTVTRTVTVDVPTTVRVTVTEAASSEPTAMINGSLDLVGADHFDVSGGHCSGNGGYDDLTSGAQVKVTTSDGDTLAIGGLDPGTASGGTCTWKYEIEVPAGVGPYFVEVTHRGSLQADKISDTLYEVAGTLGS